MSENNYTKFTAAINELGVRITHIEEKYGIKRKLIRDLLLEKARVPNHTILQILHDHGQMELLPQKYAKAREFFEAKLLEKGAA